MENSLIKLGFFVLILVWEWYEKRKVYIVSFWNSQNVFKGIHTIAVKIKNKDKMISYNEQYSGTPKVNGTFEDLLKGRPFIISYRMRGKRN